MIKPSHTSHQKRKIRKDQIQSINPSEPNSIELCCGQLVCCPASGRSQLLPLPTLHLSFCCGLHPSKHTGVILQISPLLFQVKIKEAWSRIQGISFPLIFLILHLGKDRRWLFFPLSSKYLGKTANCSRIVSPHLHLNYHFTTEGNPKSSHISKTSPFHTSPQHRRVHFSGEDPVHTTCK